MSNPRSMSSRTELTWSYEPSNLMGAREFETAVGVFKFAQGHCSIMLHHVDSHASAEQITDAREALNSLLMAAGFEAKPSYKLSGYPSLTHFDETGKRGTVLTPGTGALIATGHAVEGYGYTHDADGNIRDGTVDRWQLRAEKIRRSPELKKMLGHYEDAKRDPSRFLVDLYGIVDVLEEKYGSKTQTVRALNCSTVVDDWRCIKQLSDNRPLKEARHPGCHENLRPATDEEREMCFAAASRLIAAYEVHC